MKKVLALVLVLMMMVCASACAEAAYTYAEYNYDESLFAEVGGEWLGMAELGLQFYMPDIFMAAEVPEQLAAVGTVAVFATEDGVGVASISYGPAADAEGNVLETVEDLAGFYTSIGAANVDVIYVNGIPVITSLMAETDTLNYTVFYGDGTQTIFSFSPASDANIALVAGLFITSLQAMA